MKRYIRLPILALACLLSVLGFFSQSAGAASTHTLRATTANQSDPSGQQVIAYFTQWGIYSGFLEKNLVSSGTAGRLTILDYAFSNISPNLQCTSGDTWADYQRPFSASESVNGQADSYGQTLAGNFNQLRELKQLYPNLKIMISIGGWTWSSNFAAAAAPQNRAAFVQSCIDQFILGNLPQVNGNTSGGSGAAANIFDGFDIDWEYPGNPGNGNPYGPQDTINFTGLLQEFHNQLATLGKQTGKHYLLSAALPSGQDKYQNIQLDQIGKYLDYGNLMTYDMHGPWSATGPTDFNAPLFCDPRKLVLGIPLYGHGWTNVPNVNHGLFQSSPNMQAASPGGTANYNQLVTLNMTRYWDPVAMTAWYYDGTNFWSYDDPSSITIKMGYIRMLGLGGAMAWSLDGDDASGTLINAVYQGLHSK
jgi:chitinase